MAVFFITFHGFQTAQATELTFHRNAQLVREINNLSGDLHVVFVAGDGFTIRLQTAVHHDRAKAQINRALTYCGALAVILVHDHWNVRITFNRTQNEMLQKLLACVLAGAGAGLHDDRRPHFMGSLHDGLDLLQVVDVKSRNCVVVGCRVVQQLAH